MNLVLSIDQNLKYCILELSGGKEQKWHVPYDWQPSATFDPPPPPKSPEPVIWSPKSPKPVIIPPESLSCYVDSRENHPLLYNVKKKPFVCVLWKCFAIKLEKSWVWLEGNPWGVGGRWWGTKSSPGPNEPTPFQYSTHILHRNLQMEHGKKGHYCLDFKSWHPQRTATRNFCKSTK